MDDSEEVQVRTLKKDYPEVYRELFKQNPEEFYDAENIR